MDYQYLTVEDQARIVAEVQASVRLPEAELWEFEAAHFRAVIESKVRGLVPPDAYLPPDVSVKEDAKVVLDVEAGKLLPVPVGVVK